MAREQRRSAAILAVDLAAALLLAGAAQAEPVTYTWGGPGDVAGWVNPKQGDRTNGRSQCALRTTTIDVTVDGSRVNIRLQGEKGVRRLVTTLGQDGTFKADFTASFGPPLNNPEHGPTRAGLNDGMGHVTGQIRPDKSSVDLVSACHWGGELKRK